MPLRGVRYRVRTLPGGRHQRLAFRDSEVVEAKMLPNPGPPLAVLGVAALAGLWMLRRRPPPLATPAIPSGADPRTGQYGQQTGQGYPPFYPVRTDYLINPIIADRISTSVCEAPVLQLQPQSMAPRTTREGAGQAGPPGAWVYRTVQLPTCGIIRRGDGRGGWGSGGL